MVHDQSLIATLATAFFLTACAPNLHNSASCNELPPVFPPIDSVEIPCNIAPINIMPDLKVAERCTGIHVCFSDGNGSSLVSYGDRATQTDVDDWHKLLSTSNEIEAQISLRIDGQWITYRPQHLFVSKDKIEPYVVYRKIAPGYEVYGNMGIYQRSLETGKEHVLIDNSRTGGCMNCHNFGNHSKNRMSLHLRGGLYPGTLIKSGNKSRFINVPKDKLGASYVYPSWHTDNRHIAFSVNKTQQIFHETDKKRIEVIDHWSNIVVVDTETEEFSTNSTLSNDSTFTTFPHFSPDGKWLYYCRAKAISALNQTTDVKYAVCRVAYDAASNSIGNDEEVVVDAPAIGKSASFPRVSPDGRFLVFCMADYGQFSIWHPESDLYLMDLVSNSIKKANNINSNNVESYHSWSADGKWLIFSSRRTDGLFTQPFIAHFNAEKGEFGMPFALPLDRIQDYFEEYFSYNIPEFVEDELSEREIIVGN